MYYALLNKICEIKQLPLQLQLYIAPDETLFLTKL